VIDAARQGKTVVRLKGGDPLIFGRGAEEAQELRAAGIPYEIVPGVTAALAAGSFAEIPLTHRSAASAVAFVTGHENPAKKDSALDWAALARFPGTLVIYMGIARIETISARLIEYGKPADTPAAVVAFAGSGGQRKITATLATLVDAVRASGLAAPAVIFIGPAVGLAPAVSWFESRPLFGKRVLVTRPQQQSAEFVRKLELLGAIPVISPAIEILPPADWSQVDDRIGRLGEYDWLVFTSANGVRSFLDRLREVGGDLRALGGLKLAAIGPGTAEALKAFHLNADLVPGEYRSENLAAELAKRAAGKRFLLARADRGRDVLPAELSKVAAVDQVSVYRQVDAPPATMAEVDFVTLTSSNIARAFLRSLDHTGIDRVRAGTVRLITISPVTSAAVVEMGFPVAAEAREYTSGGLLRALVDLVSAG
jgi:uroporphyrinogen III methyltransferase/synthase